MDNPCAVCPASGACPYYGCVDGYSAECDDMIARYIDDARYEHRGAWHSYIKELNDFDSCDDSNEIQFILSSLL